MFLNSESYFLGIYFKVSSRALMEDGSLPIMISPTHDFNNVTMAFLANPSFDWNLESSYKLFLVL